MDKTIDIIKLFITGFIGCVASALGGWDNLLKLYIMLFICDLAFGACKGIKNKAFSSSILFWGFVNKFIAIIFIAIANMIDNVLNAPVQFRVIMIVWFCICEGASILENSAALGVPIPVNLRDILVQVKKGFSINITKIVKQIIDNYKIPLPEDEKGDKE